MVNPISGAPLPVPASSPASPPGAGDAGAFRELFSRTVQDVQAYQGRAARSVDSFLLGETGDLHSVALATQQAELAFEMFVQVRNKFVQAYQEVMRMQI